MVFLSQRHVYLLIFTEKRGACKCA